MNLDFAAEAATRYQEIVDGDGLREFEAARQNKPHPKQDAFVDSTEREVMLLGANRTGKSKGLAARIARRVRREGARRLWLVSPTFAMARQNMIPPLFGDPDVPSDEDKPMIPPSEIAEVRQKPDWEYIGKDGWRITIKSCEQGVTSFAGAAVDEIDFDEPPTWPVYNECAIRFAAGKQCLIRLAATLLPPPGQAGGVCQWLWSEKIEPWLNGKSPRDLKIIQVGMADNPYITPDQLALARRLYPAGSLDRRIRVDGELLPGLLGARCYAPFDRRLHVNKFLVRASVDPMKPLYIGTDFNVDPLGWVLMQKHGQIWRIVDEIALRPGTIEGACEELKKRYAQSHRATLIVRGDATGNKRTAQTGKTDYDLLATYLKDHFSLKFEVPDRNPPERDRVNLVNYFLGGGGADVRLEVGAECPETIADFEQVLWNRDASGIRKSHDKKEPYYQRTHWLDGAGYVLWASESHVIRQASRIVAPKRNIPMPYYGFAAS